MSEHDVMQDATHGYRHGWWWLILVVVLILVVAWYAWGNNNDNDKKHHKRYKCKDKKESSESYVSHDDSRSH